MRLLLSRCSDRSRRKMLMENIRDLLRRLLGVSTTEDGKTATQPSAVKVGAPAPEITLPDASVDAKPNSATAQSPGKTAASSQDLPDTAPVDATPLLFGVTRQLPPIEPIKPGKHLIYGLGSDVGMVRTNNQDSVFTMFTSNISADNQPDFGLFVVADGMGGHHEGERASAIAVRSVAKHILDNFYHTLLNPPSPDAEKPMIVDILSEAIQKANEAVSEQIPEGGTTVTAATLVGDLLYLAHVGDSRAYMISKDGIEQLTRDHSLVQRLIELDQLTPEEAASHPQRNVLYRAVGQNDNLEVDASTYRMPAGARLLLCSDGLWNQISSDNLLQIVRAAKSPQDACDHLITVANDRGGPDNITVVLVQVPG
jgi:serine/threonine protein phosphatase PrpC